jgi:hypothetical protein
MNPATEQQNTSPENNPTPTPQLNISRFSRLTSNRPLIIGMLITGLLILGILVFINPIYGITAFCLAFVAFVFIYPDNFLQSFAQANNYTYLDDGFVDEQTGLIFSIGYAPDFREIVYGLYGDWPFFLFIYSYSMGYDENSKRYSRTVLHLNFEAELPAFVLRKQNLLQVVEDEGESLKTNGYTEKLDLEGDFDQYFQVFIRPDTQDDVLSVLTPDVMELVIKLTKCEVEMTADGKLYVYYHSVVRHKQELVDAYSVVETLTPKISAYINRQQQLHPEIEQPTS